MKTSSARRASVLEPAVLAAVDLDQLAVFARQPQALGNHPPAQGLSPHAQTVFFEQNFCCECRSEVNVPSPDQLDCISPDACVQATIRLAASGLVDQRTAAAVFDSSR